MNFSPSRVSVVVVSFNTREKLHRCLSCVETDHELIVVDNGSSDGSAEMVREQFPRAKLIANSGNVGFGAANNQGMELASRELVLFLNSDCYAEPGAIRMLAKAFQPVSDYDDPVLESNVMAAGGKLVNPDGSLQESVANELTLWAVFCEQTYLEKVFPKFRFFNAYWATGRAWKHYRDSWELGLYADALAQDYPPWVMAEQLMGACLMIRPIEKFDERFFLYCEDTDLCRRLSRRGTLRWIPEAVFVHDLGSSSEGASRWLSVARYNRGKELYFSIHHGSLASAACWMLDRFGAFLRLVLYLVMDLLTVGRKHAQVGLWWKVLTAPAKGPDRR